MSEMTDQYTAQLQALLPRGRAWPRQPGAVLTRLLAGLAGALARTHNRALDLLDEADPRTTVELLADWERVAGLPDSCLPATGTVQERRDALVARLTARGGQSRRFFIDLAAALGFTVTITEFRPFRAGAAAAGDALTNGDWVFTWRVEAPATTVREFRAGSSAAGEPLRIWGNALLECALGRVKPAHTIVLFGYGGP